jgi:hypothetical protein
MNGVGLAPHRGFAVNNAERLAFRAASCCSSCRPLAGLARDTAHALCTAEIG